MTRPSSLARALIAATTGATSWAASMPACQPVPQRAARSIACGAEPPIHSGRGFCTGRGLMLAASSRKNSPSKSTAFSVQSRVRIVSASFTRFAAPARRLARGHVIPGAGAADAEGGQQPAFGQHVDGRALLGHDHRVADPEAGDIHAELDAPGCAGERGHDGHAFERGLAADDPVGLPDGVDAAGVAEVHPLPEAAGVVEGEVRYADAGTD